jgi:menaquinol-cytochrome c reductase iron-sulfur subunit
MKRTQADKQDECTSRRGLIMGAIYSIPFLIGGTLTASIGNYLFGKYKTSGNGWADAGDVADMPAGSPHLVRFERAVVDGWKVRNEQSSAWIILDEQHRVTAFSPLCTHLGCAYRWQAERKSFTCPCHGSAFNIQGDVITGPASRPLDRYSAKVEGDRLWLGPLQDSQAHS